MRKANCEAVEVVDTDSSGPFAAVAIVAERDIAVGEELTFCYLGSFVRGGRETLSPWGFECACPRCVGTMPAAQLTAFDDRHKCTDV